MKKENIVIKKFTKDEINHTRIALEYIMSGRELILNNERYMLAETDKDGSMVVLITQDDDVLGVHLSLAEFIEKVSALSFDTAFILSSELALAKK